jgi:hypothetical protein
VRRVAQAPSHHEVELRQPEQQDERTGTAWRLVRDVRPDGTMPPLTFGRLQAAQACAGRMDPVQARVVAVERDGWRRVVGASEA